MSALALTALTSLFLGLWTARVAGVLAAFSQFVMAGLVSAGPSCGAGAMRGINRTVLKTEFVLALIAIAPISVAFAAYAGLLLDGTPRTLLVLAAGIYGPGVLGVTVLGNVPMNERLARLEADGTRSAAYWRVYAPRWTRLNHLRTAAATATAVLYLLAAFALAGMN